MSIVEKTEIVRQVVETRYVTDGIDETCSMPTMSRDIPDATGRRDWLARTIEVYRLGRLNIEQDLRCELVDRILALTGRELPTDLIYVRGDRRTARASLDGISFRLMDHRLVRLSACTYCGVGEFESPTLERQADLGYALLDWKPHCADCAPSDPAD